MIVLFTAGQLGNQIFQYALIDKIKDKDEKIVTSRCEYFDIFKYEQSNYIFLNKYIRFILRRILKLLSRIRIISLIKQDQNYINGYKIYIDSYTYKKGLFSFIKIVEGFYQSDKFINLLPKVNDKYIQEADEYLSDIPKNVQKVFVHIRKGDYLEWSILGKKNPSLPLTYYKLVIIKLQKELENPYFIFLSNDSEYIEKEFDYIINKKVSKNSVGVDIAIMHSCENAILSNSTLSWWGVNLMSKKNKIIAPKYWLGWQSKIWYPKGIELDFVKYIEVT